MAYIYSAVGCPNVHSGLYDERSMYLSLKKRSEEEGTGISD